MLVEIWSDIVCPFCYIGKRKFEQALDRFPHKDQVTVVWKSFQLDPDADLAGADYIKTLSSRKGWTLEQTRQITNDVRNMAQAVNLDYHFDQAISANSFDAHRFAHLASVHGLQDLAEEALFKAHFTAGKNIADRNTLVQLGASIGLDSDLVKQTLDSDAYVESVQKDILEAQQLRISGVPFFVFDRKYAVSGAQAPEVFLNTLEQAFESEQTVG